MKILIIISILLISLNNLYSKELSEYKEIIEKYESLELNIENIKLAINDLEIKNPQSVLKLIIIESGNLKSKLTKQGNNLFGMRKAQRRKNTALQKTLYGYATYKTWIHSLIDYKLWELSSPPRKNEDFKKYLKRRKWN